MPGVFAGGDVADSAGAVIHAIAVGRKAARSIDKALGGSGNIDEILFPRIGRITIWGLRKGLHCLPGQKYRSLISKPE